MLINVHVTGAKPISSSPEITKELDEVEVLQGQPITLECHVSGASDAHVKWFHDNVLLTDNERITTSFDGVVCVLTIQRSILDDEGDYLCQIENDQGVVSSSSEVIVDEGMALPIFKEPLKNTSITEGENVCFDIRVVGNPEPVVEWFKDGVQLEDEGRIMIIDDVDDDQPELFSLVIEKCEQSDVGLYKCIAMNEAGKDSCSAQLQVTSSSVAQKSPDIAKIPVDVTEGQDVTLKALSSAQLPKVIWLKDDEPLMQSTHYDIDAKQGIHTLTIRNALPEDSGIYKFDTNDDSTSIFKVTIKGNTSKFDFQRENLVYEKLWKAVMCLIRYTKNALRRCSLSVSFAIILFFNSSTNNLLFLSLKYLRKLCLLECFSKFVEECFHVIMVFIKARFG